MGSLIVVVVAMGIYVLGVVVNFYLGRTWYQVKGSTLTHALKGLLQELRE